MADTNPQQQQQPTNIQEGDGTTKPSELNPDGTPKTTESNTPPDEEEQQAGEEGAESGEEEGEETPAPTDAEAYWARVNALHGREIKVDFEAAGVKDPLSPEGVFVREKTLWNEAQTDFEETLKKTDPRGYAYLLHRRLGGSDEEFLSTSTASLPDKEVLKSDVNLQKALVRQDLLQRKAIGEEYIDAVVDKMVADNKIAAAALATHERISQQEVERMSNNQKKLDAAQAELVTKLETLSTGLQKTLTQDLKFMVPDTQQADFMQYVTSTIRQDEDGNFVAALPVKGEELKNLMQALYLVHSKGDLTATVQKQAGKQRVERLRLAAEARPASSGGAPAKGGKKLTDVW